MATPWEVRKARYFALSSQLALIDSARLAALFQEAGSGQGWGATHTISVGGTKVFVKRVPLTELEYENLYSTANLYEMPTFYNYGVGSAGFGAFRELVAHIKTTNWVLEGAMPNFPLMYHYRIVPYSRPRSEVDEERHQGYIQYWNSDPNIDRYIRARRDAPYELILFLEHIPDVLHSWWVRNLNKSETVIREMRRTLAFLREQGVIHFDAHFGNILVDGDTPYLTDFGLVLDRQFTLDASEKAFFQRHIDYDDAEFLLCLGSYLVTIYQNLSPAVRSKVMQRYEIPEGIDYGELISLTLENFERIHSDGLFKLDEYYVATIREHLPLIQTMHQFYREMRQNNQKDTHYPQRKIKRFLKEAGWR